MLDGRDRARIREIAGRYGSPTVWLFGSSARAEVQAHDIDLAVEGLAAERFFAFYGELLMALSKPVDLVDLSTSPRFVDVVRREGILIE